MKIFDVNWKAVTAGPSPHNNERTEVFLLGCKKALEGNPCKGCFNQATWNANLATIEDTPEEAAENIFKYAPNKYITIGGGEPTDQIDELIIFTRLLKEKGYHVMMYTWRSLYAIIKGEYSEDFKLKFLTLMNSIDILVDGEFQEENKLYIHDQSDGLFGSVGSGNQIIWDVKAYHESKRIVGQKMFNLTALQLNEHNELMFTVKNKDQKEIIELGG